MYALLLEFFLALIIFRNNQSMICIKFDHGFGKTAKFPLFCLAIVYIPAYLNKLYNFCPFFYNKIDLTVMNIFPIIQFLFRVDGLVSLQFEKYDVFGKAAYILGKLESNSMELN